MTMTHPPWAARADDFCLSAVPRRSHKLFDSTVRRSSRARASRGCRLRQSAQTARRGSEALDGVQGITWLGLDTAPRRCVGRRGKASAERSLPPLSSSEVCGRSLPACANARRASAGALVSRTLAIGERQHDEASDRAVSRVRARDSKQPHPRSVHSFARARCVARDAVGHGQVHASGPRQERSSALASPWACASRVGTI